MVEIIKQSAMELNLLVPAKAGTQSLLPRLDSRLRGNERKRTHLKSMI
jgi:hypothetical protein